MPITSGEFAGGGGGGSGGGGGGGGTVSGITSTGGTITVTNPTGPTTDVEVTPFSYVSSAFGRTGAVAATTGDYTVSQVTGAAALASPTFTGTPSLPTGATGVTQSALTNNTTLATTAYTDTGIGVETTRALAAEALLAPKASPTFTGTPLAPTAALGTNTTQIATTAFVEAAAFVPSTGPGIWLPAPSGDATGATDHTTITNAANALAALPSGGTLHFQDGTYITTPLVHPSGVVFAGDSRAGTVLQLAAGSNADLLVSVNFATNTNTGNNGPSGFGLRTITLDANNTNQTTLSRCWVVYGYNYIVDDVWFINGYGGGVYSEWGGSANPMESFWRNVKIWNYGYIQGRSASAVGLDWNGPHDSQFTNVIVATLNSSINYQDATYGSTPINGTQANFPTASTSFTFATTTAAPTYLYPTTGGNFIVPLATTPAALATSPTPEPSWTTITYTACSTTGAVTTFTGCTAPVGVANFVYLGTGAHGISVPAYHYRSNGGAGGHGANGEIFTACHFWGRSHFALYSTDSFFATNCYAEGAMIANVVIPSSSSWLGGIVLGTFGNSGHQPTEVGFSIGRDVASSSHARTLVIDDVILSNFATPGAGVAFTNDTGGNVVNAVSDNTALYTGAPSSNDEIELVYWGSPSTGLYNSTAPTAGSSCQVFTQQSGTISAVSIVGTAVTITLVGTLPTLVNGNGVYVTGITGVGATTLYSVSAVSTTGGQTTFTITTFPGASWTSGGTVTQSSFTYTVPTKCTTIQIELVSGGGGGQAGSVNAIGSVCNGGTGGNPGAYGRMMVPATGAYQPNATLTATVGNGGAGGLGVTTGTGNSGGTGQPSSFGSVLQLNGGSGGNGGNGGTTFGNTSTQGVTSMGAAAGVSGAAGVNATTLGFCGSGGSGGGVTAFNVASAGGNGAFGAGNVNNHGNGGAVGVNGTDGVTNAVTDIATGGGGGGGGGSATSGSAGNGGNGSVYGASGGGGGAMQTGGTSGSGGNGAPGVVVVSTW